MTYKAGIIGTGGIAGMGILGMHDEDQIGREKIRTSHAGGYTAAQDIDLVAVADVDEENLTTFGEAWDITVDRQYVGHEGMLEAEDLDVVSVCTPTFLHHDHVVDAARIGDPDVIWCEKPIASSFADGREMIETCDNTGTELVINHSFRFTEKLQQLRTLVQEEDILGDINSVSTQFRMELVRNSTHLLDTLMFLLDTRAKQVAGYVNGKNEAVDALDADETVDDAGGGGFIVMKDGTFVTVDCTIPRDISSMNLQFIGTDGKLAMNNDDGEWRYWALDDGEHTEADIPGIDSAWTWDNDYTDAFANAADHIVDLLDREADNISSGRDALLSMEIIVAIYVSHYTGGQVAIPLERPLHEIEITSW